MTQIIYNFPVELATNGDCSEIKIKFPEGNKDLIEELKINLIKQGFPVWFGPKNDENSITFSTLAMKND